MMENLHTLEKGFLAIALLILSAVISTCNSVSDFIKLFPFLLKGWAVVALVWLCFLALKKIAKFLP